MTTSLQKYLKRRFGLYLTAKEEEILLSNLKVEIEDHRTVLLSLGAIESHFYVVVSGLVRKYVPKQTAIINASMQITGYGGVACSIGSYFNEMPSQFEIVTLQESEILYCPKRLFEQYNHYEGIRRLYHKLIYESIRQYEELQEMRVRHSGFTERLAFFASKNEDVFLNAKQKDMAGLLALAPESFNRLRLKALKLLSKAKV